MLSIVPHSMPIIVICIVIVRILRRRWSTASKLSPSAEADHQKLISINILSSAQSPQQQFAAELPLKLISSVQQGHSHAFLVDQQGDAPRGIYKPIVNDIDEVPSMKRRGALSSDGACNEVAAFYLDHDDLAGVPKTCFVIRDGEPIGSVQTFVTHFELADNISSSMFSVSNVHAIALLDLRLVNLDRHLGNLLCCRAPGEDRVTLVPIDHSLIMPDYQCMSDAWFAWYSWHQSSIPFSSDMTSYIASLDPLADVPILQQIGVRSVCIIAYLIASRFVKVAMGNGFNLKQMAEFMQRDVLHPEQPSVLENVVAQAIHLTRFQHTSLVEISNWAASEELRRFLDVIQDQISMVIH